MKIGEVAAINPPVDRITDDSPVTFMGMAQVNTDGTIAPCELKAFGQVKQGYTPFRRGDLLLAKITPCFENGKIAQANIQTEYGMGSTEFHVIRPTAGMLDARFALHFLRNMELRVSLAGKMTGSAGQRRVPVGALENAWLPLPPVDEQRRIAGILDQADALRDKRRQALAQVEQLTESAFLEMFGDFRSGRSRFEIRVLGEMVSVSSGKPLKVSRLVSDGTFPVYGGNGINGYHDEYLFEERKVVLGRVGVYCGAVHHTVPKSWITDNALYVREKFAPLEDGYLVEAIRLADLNRFAGRSAQPVISGKALKAVEIPLPPLELQHEFSRQVEAIERLKASHHRSLEEMDALFASLQHRAFRGEL